MKAEGLHIIPDEELLEKIKQDDRAAFAVLFGRYWQPLLDTAYRRLGSEQQAEELVQDIFMNLYLKRNELEITVSLKSYLYTALKYKVLNEIRGAIVRNNYKTAALAATPLYEDISSKLEAKELEQEISKKLKLLPEKCREVFILSRENNLPHKRIAQQLGISVSTVEKHIVKALKIMRSNLKEYQLELLWFLVLPFVK